MIFKRIYRSIVLNAPLAALLLALSSGCATPCRAAEAGTGAYWPGFRNYMAGVVPPKPGSYLRNDFVGYSASVPKVVINGLAVGDAKIDALLEVIEPEYVLPRKLWGANHAVLITQGLAYVELSGTVLGPNIRASGNRFAPTNPVVSPLFLGWQKGNLHYNANLAIFVPINDYNITRVVNQDRNFWTFDLEFGMTHFDPKVGWDFSGVLGYSINTQNSTTRYRSGDVLHLDFAVGKVLKSRLKPGVSGYAWVQVSPDTGAGAILGSYKSRVFGIGPIVQMPLSPHSSISLRYYHEFGAVDHLEGEQAALTFRAAF